MKIAVLPTPDWLDRGRVDAYLQKLAEKRHDAIVISCMTYVEHTAGSLGLRVAAVRVLSAIGDARPKPEFRHFDFPFGPDDEAPAGYLEAKARAVLAEREYHDRIAAASGRFMLEIDELTLGALTGQHRLGLRYESKEAAAEGALELAVDLADAVVVFERHEGSSPAATRAGAAGKKLQLLA